MMHHHRKRVLIPIDSIGEVNFFAATNKSFYKGLFASQSLQLNGYV